jgi:energy-coupling factor transport system ATP-binding protein
MIKTEHLSHVYSEHTPFEKVAIGDINLEIEQGEFVGVIGHTGSGKSTLIQHLNGLLKPTSGKIYIDGKDIWSEENKKNIRNVRFLVGLVFQYPEYQLFEETVFQDIAFGPKNMGLSEDEIHERVLEAMDFVGLKQKYQQKSPFDLSGGQKRRVAIAGVIAMRPKVLILDEPTAGLDPKGRDKILGQIKEYHEQTNSTILLVSHSMEDIAKYAQKVLVMNRASVFAYDTVEHIFQKSEQLTKMGLSVPQVNRVFLELKKKGYPVSENIYTIDQAEKEILRILNQKGECCHA